MNPLLQLTERDIGIVKRCLHAALEGPFFPDWEFPILFGFDRYELATQLTDWQANLQSGKAYGTALTVLGGLQGYPHGLMNELEERVGCSAEEIFQILASLRDARK